MRKKIVAGNWKMNLNRAESIQLVTEISKKIKEIDFGKNRVVVAPVSVNLTSVVENKANDSRIEYASQNMHFADSGAYTGEISVNMLKDINVGITLLGHSERREYFNEDDALLKQKVDQAMANEMEVIFCFGEKLEDRQADNHFSVVASQITNALFHLDSNNWKNIVLAYEPVWAIGTGMTASPEQAQEMHAFIRNLVKENYNNDLAQNVSILYGGSVKPTNAKEIFGKEDVDGGLIGGAALKAEMFAGIIEAMQ